MLSPHPHEVGAVPASHDVGVKPRVKDEGFSVLHLILGFQTGDLADCADREQAAIGKLDGLGIPHPLGQGFIHDDFLVFDVPAPAFVVTDACPHTCGVGAMGVGGHDVAVAEVDQLCGKSPERHLFRNAPGETSVIGGALPYVLARGKLGAGNGQDPAGGHGQQAGFVVSDLVCGVEEHGRECPGPSAVRGTG